MAKTSSKVKNRWNNAHYDRITITVKKGYKEIIKQHIDKNGESMASYIMKLIQQDIGIDKFTNTSENKIEEN